jgi:hypothetical protein
MGLYGCLINYPRRLLFHVTVANPVCVRACARQVGLLLAHCCLKFFTNKTAWRKWALTLSMLQNRYVVKNRCQYLFWTAPGITKVKINFSAISCCLRSTTNQITNGEYLCFCGYKEPKWSHLFYEFISVERVNKYSNHSSGARGILVFHKTRPYWFKTEIILITYFLA